VLVAAIYDGAVFYSRWSDDREMERRRAAKEAEQARKLMGMLGDDSLKILAFYAMPGIVRLGENASLCYGVSGAKAVHLEPPVEEVWPSQTRCIQVSPRKDTEYKLTAEDGAGHTVSQEFVLKVAR